MIRIPLGEGAYKRSYADLPEVLMENRFFESNPTTEEAASLISRPGTSNMILSGTAPFRAVWTKEGIFGGDLFFANLSGLYRYELGDTPNLISGSHNYSSFDISFAAASGLYYTNLFVAYDGTLKYYAGESYAKAFVSYDAVNPPDDQEVRIGTIHYKFRGVGGVDDGSPAGTALNPYLLDIDTSLPTVYAQWQYALDVLVKAINDTGVRGVDYSSTIIAAHGAVHATYREFFGISADLQWKQRGSAGNAEEIESVSGGIIIGNASGTATTGTLNFEGGGLHELVDVDMPDDLEVSKVAAVGGFVLAVEKDSNRFFFIRPGETEIRPLDFESVESEPDEIEDIVSAGDFVYIFGRSSVEAWYVAGDAERPIQRLAGGSHRVGAWGNTAAVVNQTPVFVGTDNVVYALGGSPQRISNHGIEERLRTAGMQAKVAWSFVLDGHFFYVLTIAGQGTFVYDATVQQWYRWWTEGRQPYWNCVRGAQWRTFSLGIDWDGDRIWHINPSALTDEGSSALEISRAVTGFLPLRERKHARCSLVRVFASVGNPGGVEPPPALALRFSDDNGQTWKGPYTLPLLDVPGGQQLDFRSLGRVGFPGRIFELSDIAGLVRIDAAYAQLD